jgi:CRP/FNR family transcriptional regulator, cyclic AMP receptor protein
MGLASRFLGTDGRARLIEALEQQEILSGEKAAVLEIAAVASVRDVAPAEVLIQQDAAECGLYFILAGTFRVLVNGRDVAIRRERDLVGEMATVNPSAGRTASVVASAPGVVAKLEEADFLRIADAHPRVWRLVARGLARRLDQRRQFHFTPNARPILFIGSSSESLPVAKAFEAAIPGSAAETRLWTGVFKASSFPIDNLAAQVHVCDFAVLVAAPDDRVFSRWRASNAPRDNVIFELGLFMGEISLARTFLLDPGNVKLPSDLKGINTLRYKPKVKDLAAAVADAAAELVKIIGSDGAK